MYKIPVAIITVFHPEDFLEVSFRDLCSLPALCKNRAEQESRKTKIALNKSFSTTTEVMHDRPVINFGKPKYSFRGNRIQGAVLAGLITDYQARLIDTEETGTQARFRVEFRPNWGSESHTLPNHLTQRLVHNVSKSMLSVRQLWVNPFTIDLKSTPGGLFYNSAHTLNFVVGPQDSPHGAQTGIKKAQREAKIKFIKHPTPVVIHEHCPFYQDDIDEHEIRTVTGCNLWWGEYE